MNPRRTRHVLSLAVLLAAPVASADTVTLASSRDTTLYEVMEGDIANGAGEYAFVGLTSAFGQRRTLIRFDLSPIPIGSTITQAMIRLNVSRTVPSDLPVDVHRVAADWGEGASDAGEPGGAGAPAEPGDATWTQRFFTQDRDWATLGGDFISAPSASVSLGPDPGPVTWSGAGLVSDLQGWIAQPSSNFGWIFITPPDVGGARRFDTRENTNPANRPQLLVTFTPACIADFNHDGSATVQDIFDFLTAYFTSDPTADINGGGVSVQDIFDFLFAYFAGCG